MEKKVLTQEEIDGINTLRQDFTNLTNIIGNIEVQIMNLQLQKENLKEKFKNFKEKETNLTQNLEKKYGNGTISLESGEFIPTN